MRPRAVHFNGQPSNIKKMTILNMRTKIIFRRNENKDIAKGFLVKSIVGLHCELLLNLIAPFLFFKFLYKPKFMTFRESHFQNT